MNILFIVPYVPSLIRTRSYNLVRFMAQLGHTVTVTTLWTDDREAADLASLRDLPLRVEGLRQARWRSLWNCLLALPTHTPLQAVFSWNPELARLSGDLLECNDKDAIDVIHVEHLRGARYGIYLKTRFPDIPVVWDSVDCISYLFEQASGQSRSGFGRLITSLDLNRTRRYEGQLPAQVDHVVITSQVDRQALLDLLPDQKAAAPISILPNGVDWGYFSQNSRVEREPATLVMSGKMSYHANVSMALYLVNEIMPIVWAKRPDVKVNIAGKDPPASVRSLAQNPAVDVTGTVDDIRPYLQKASVAIVPMLYGAGSQFKALEAMACGTPVVATPRAVQALAVVPDRDILLGGSPVELAGQVLRLIEEPDYQRQVGQAGRRYVEENHQWAKIAKVLEGVYHEVVSTRRERRIQ
jgi:glycosyltransferase involved in cell wall biosynthesis